MLAARRVREVNTIYQASILKIITFNLELSMRISIVGHMRLVRKVWSILWLGLPAPATTGVLLTIVRSVFVVVITHIMFRVPWSRMMVHGLAELHQREQTGQEDYTKHQYLLDEQHRQQDGEEKCLQVEERDQR